jgi:hypothetical protein
MLGTTLAPAEVEEPAVAVELFMQMFPSSTVPRHMQSSLINSGTPVLIHVTIRMPIAPGGVSRVLWVLAKMVDASG